MSIMRMITSLGTSTKLLHAGPVSTWMGDGVQASTVIHLGNVSYVTAAEVDSAFYPPWDGKISISFRVQ